MTDSNDLARSLGHLDIIRAELGQTMVNMTNTEANREASFPILDAVYDILVDAAGGKGLEIDEIGELAEMQREGIQRARGIRAEPLESDDVMSERQVTSLNVEPVAGLPVQANNHGHIR